MKKIFLLILFLSVLSLFSNSKEDEVKLVREPKTPLYGEWKFELIEDMIIGETNNESPFFIEPWKLEVKIDGEENIYVLDSKECKVLKFKKNGNFILSIGRKGEGPGEFSRPGPWYVEKKQAVWVYDSNGERLIKFNTSGKVVKEFKIGRQLWDFYVDEKGRIFGLTSEWSKEGRIISLVRFSPEGKLEKRLMEAPEELSVHLVTQGVVSFSHPYLFHPFFSHVEKNIFVYGYSSEYKLIFINSEGNKIRVIRKEEDKTPVGADIKEEVLGWFNISPQLRKNIAFAPYIPFFDGILTDNEGRVYVRRLPTSTREFKFTLFDIFSKEGNFIYKTVFKFDPTLIDNGYIFNLRFDEEKERYILTRYRVKNWNSFRKR